MAADACIPAGVVQSRRGSHPRPAALKLLRAPTEGVYSRARDWEVTVRTMKMMSMIAAVVLATAACSRQEPQQPAAPASQPEGAAAAPASSAAAEAPRTGSA